MARTSSVDDRLSTTTTKVGRVGGGADQAPRPVGEGEAHAIDRVDIGNCTPGDLLARILLRAEIRDDPVNDVVLHLVRAGGRHGGRSIADRQVAF